MNRYNVNWPVLVNWLLPPRLRNVVMSAWLNALVSTTAYVDGLFQANRDANLYNLAHNGQVCKLEAVLNDVFDDVNHGIVIVDGPVQQPTYVFQSAELKPLYVYQDSEVPGLVAPQFVPYLWQDSETQGGGYDFIVQVPNAIFLGAGFNQPRMVALIEQYRLPSMNNYNIIGI
jgi:hypothetical protein